MLYLINRRPIKHFLSRATLLLFVLFIIGCSQNSWTLDFSSNRSTNSIPPNTNTPLRPAITVPDWVAVQPGVDYKQQAVTISTAEEVFHLVRIDQTQAVAQVAVAETTPQSVSDWAAQLGANVVINGSYFDEQYQLVTRTKVDEQTYGVLLSGPTGVVYLDNAEQLWRIIPWSGADITAATALQSYPVLLSDGDIKFTTGSQASAQRTVIATDGEQRLYFIVAEYGVLSLAELAQALAKLDISNLTALNLDGGPSTGLFVAGNEAVSFTDDSAPVPSVLYILPPS